MHELAHILLHRASVIDDESDFASRIGQERAANEFAANVLLPDSFLLRIDLERKPGDVGAYDDWLSAYRRQWGVSSEVILIRLVSRGRISQQEYDEYKAWVFSRQEVEVAEGVRMYRHREPRNIFGDRYVRSVLEALDQQRITINKASKFLDGLKLSDIRKLESYCATH
jgi:Zn-dependent peptidase ImmA (M78 family)